MKSCMHHLKRSQVLSDLERSGSLAADLVDGHALGGYLFVSTNIDPRSYESTTELS